MPPRIPPENRPLTPAEREKFRETLQGRDLLDRFIGLTFLHTGVKAPTLAHIRDDWVSRRNGRLEIFVPGYDIECDIGGRQGHGRHAWGKGDGPCTDCKEDGTYSVALEPRRIPIADSETEDVVENWFTVYDRVVPSATVYDRLETLADVTGIDRLNVTVLRHTFGLLLTEKGFDLETIHHLLGYEDNEAMESLTRRYGRYVEGFNPYLCGDETNDGDRCQIQTATREARCQYHSED